MNNKGKGFNSNSRNNSKEQLDNIFNEDDNPFENRYLKKDPDFFLITLIISAVIVSLVVIGAVFFFSGNNGDSKTTANSEYQDIEKGLSVYKKKNDWNLFGRRENLLLLGVDSNGNESDPFKGTRSDSIMILNIDHFSKTVNVVSIPRDSKVYIADNHGVDKINAAHAFGGAELTKKTIEQMFGIKINHYVEINYAGIDKLVDALGGVPVNVEKRMHYTDRAGGLFIDLQPGPQILNAKQSIGYIRFRHDAISDIGRMDRQKWFLKGIVSKLQSPAIIPKLPEIIHVASEYVRTDMNIFELSRYAALAKLIKLDQSQISTLPGGPSHNQYISYWILEPDKTQEVIDKLIYRQEPPVTKENISVSLLYNDALSGQIDTIKQDLIEKKFDVACTNHTNRAHTEIIGHSEFVSTRLTNKIKKIVPELKNAPYSFLPDNYLCGETDLTIVLSGKE